MPFLHRKRKVVLVRFTVLQRSVQRRFLCLLHPERRKVQHQFQLLLRRLLWRYLRGCVPGQRQFVFQQRPVLPFLLKQRLQQSMQRTSLLRRERQLLFLGLSVLQ